MSNWAWEMGPCRPSVACEAALVASSLRKKLDKLMNNSTNNGTKLSLIYDAKEMNLILGI